MSSTHFRRWLRGPLVVPSALLAGLVRVRNGLYDRGYRRPVRFAVPLIGVGNLTVGGAGKTPHVEYLLRWLAPHVRVATLSRGYGRQTRGFRLAGPADSATTLGDEPMQFFRKFGPRVRVAVGEKRVQAIPQLMALASPPEVIVLDDAFQHRAVQPHCQLLLTEYAQPLSRDYVWPRGRLREPRQGAHRADALVVTKCPSQLSAADRVTLTAELRPYVRPEVPIFFTTTTYLPPQPVFAETPFEWPAAARVLLFCGLARPAPLRAHVAAAYTLQDFVAFPDHHAYTTREVEALARRWRQLANPAAVLLTTEKDMVKLLPAALAEVLRGVPIFYLPIAVKFLADEPQFRTVVRRLTATAWPN